MPRTRSGSRLRSGNPRRLLSSCVVSEILDDRFANPAYALLLLLGLAMVFTNGIPITTFWIATALVLYVILVLVALIGYSPTLKKQITALESGGPKSEEYARLNQRSNVIGIVLMLDVIIIVFLMVVKPAP